MISLPAIGYLSELNRLIDFGWLGTDINNYITDNEAKLGTLTHFLVSVTGFGQGLLLVLVVAVIAAISEEIFFRGLIQNLLLRSSNNPHLAIWVTAFIFGFIHMQFLSMLPRVLLGALFGYVYYWSGNLYLAIAGHFINNFVTAIGMIALVEAKLPDTTLDSAPWWAGLLSALGLAFGAYLFRRQLYESFADAD
jgi:membrane protease YdiL (CAAX protease family)